MFEFIINVDGGCGSDNYFWYREREVLFVMVFKNFYLLKIKVGLVNFYLGMYFF